MCHISKCVIVHPLQSVVKTKQNCMMRRFIFIGRVFSKIAKTLLNKWYRKGHSICSQLKRICNASIKSTIHKLTKNSRLIANLIDKKRQLSRKRKKRDKGKIYHFYLFYTLQRCAVHDLFEPLIKVIQSGRVIFDYFFQLGIFSRYLSESGAQCIHNIL